MERENGELEREVIVVGRKRRAAERRARSFVGANSAGGSDFGDPARALRAVPHPRSRFVE